MSTPRQSLPAVLTRLREKAGMSLRDLENASGISRSVISRLESGEKQRGTPQTLLALAQALQVDASELLTAAGYTAAKADALPNLQVYLRAKYGHLSATERQGVTQYVQRLEAERRNSKPKPATATKQRNPRTRKEVS